MDDILEVADRKFESGKWKHAGIYAVKEDFSKGACAMIHSTVPKLNDNGEIVWKCKEGCDG